MLVVVLTGPGLGAKADALGKRKRFLVIFCTIGSAATCLMALVGPGDVIPAMFLVIVSAYAFAAGNIFYNSFLPDLSDRRTMGRVSGLAWGLGYLGGGLCLVAVLVIMQVPDWIGRDDPDQWAVRLGVGLSGVWWFVFALPTFLWVKETRRPTRRTASEGRRLHSVLDTLSHLASYRTLFLFVLAFLLYSNGVEAILSAAALFGGEELKMEPDEIVTCFLMIQGVALVGSLGFGWLADRIGNKPAVLGSLVLWVMVLAWAWFVTSQTEFWIMGAVVGLVMGGTQATSRSLMGMMTPAAHKAEFFGFYALGGRMAAVLGPLVCGVVAHVTDSMRHSVLSLIVFFVIGGALLAGVNVRRGLREKEEADARDGMIDETLDSGEI
jgi:UMF1 family MFS transporter